MTLPPMIEYLLSLPNPKGGTGKLVQLGVNLTVVPVFPPGFNYTGFLYPRTGTYCMIEFGWKQSPDMVPGAFYATQHHSGLVLSEGMVSELTLSETWNVWLEVTRNNPLSFSYTNITAAAQYFEAIDFFLIIQNEDDYKLVHKIVSEWRRGGLA